MSPVDSPLIIRQLSRRVPRTAMREFLGELSRRVARGRQIVCLITDDRELRSLNRQFRGKNYATDVLSFPAAQSRDRQGAVRKRDKMEPVPHDDSLGELAISIDRAAAQAAEYGHSITDELRILMLHGALHLAGFDHEKDSGEMARAEVRWRKRLGLPSGLIERAGDPIAKPSRANGRTRQ
jgi:probable rRNA maturation factor